MKSEVYLPSEKEIEEACAKERESWSENMEQKRLRADWRRKPALVKEIELPATMRLKPEMPD